MKILHAHGRAMVLGGSRLALWLGALSVAALLAPAPTSAQSCELPIMMQLASNPNVLLAYDTSGSMREPVDYAIAPYQANPGVGPDYLATFEAQLTAFDPATSPLDEYMNDLNGANHGFDDAAIYDQGDQKICDSHAHEPCLSSFTTAARCNLGLAVDSPATCDGKTPASPVSSPGTDFAYGKGYAWPWWGDSDGSRVEGTDPHWHHDQIQSVFQGRYLNYLHVNGLRDNPARQAARDLVDATRATMNWGLMSLTHRVTSSDPGLAARGGRLLEEIDPSDSESSADNTIDAMMNHQGTVTQSCWNSGSCFGWSQSGLQMNGFGSTPLAMQLHDVYRYFRGDFTNYGSGQPNFASPVDVECRQNFAVVMTDGYPSSEDYSEADVAGLSIGGSTCGTSYDDADDDKALDDLARCIYEQGDVSDTISGRQALTIYTVGFVTQAADALDLLEDAGEGAGGSFVSSTNATQLAQAFEDVSESIMAQNVMAASGTGGAVRSTEALGGDLLLRAQYESGTWEGSLEGFALPYTVGDPALWNAGTLLEARSAASRSVYTVRDTGDTDDRMDDRIELTSGNAAALQALLGAATEAEAQEIIDWTRGVDVAGYRTRDVDADGQVWKLGDIVSSSPVVVAAPAMFFDEASYVSFSVANENRRSMAYVAANDGGLHAFDAATGAESWMLVPHFNLPRLKELADANYCHQFTFDGTPRVIDAFLSVDGAVADWRTILVVGAGQRGVGEPGAYVALDVTDPGTLASPNPPVVLWQWPNPVDPTVPDVLGETRLGQPVERAVLGFQHHATQDFPSSSSSWRAVIGSGPKNDTSGTEKCTPHVFDVSLAEGVLHASYKLEVGAGNDVPGCSPRDWTSEPSLVDINSDGEFDRAYVGTDSGDLWRIRFDDPASRQLVLETSRPISSRPVPAFASSTGGDPDVMLYFGTGRLREIDDSTDMSVQRLYAVRDKSTTTESSPLANPLWGHSDLTDMTDVDLTLTDPPVAGWFIDLLLGAGGEPSSSATAEGARILSPPLVLQGLVFAPVFTPVMGVCGLDGVATLLSTSMWTGNPPASPMVDQNDDGVVNDSDKVSGSVSRGKNLGAGIPATPVLDTVRNQLLIQKSDTIVVPVTIAPPPVLESHAWRLRHP